MFRLLKVLTNIWKSFLQKVIVKSILFLLLVLFQVQTSSAQNIDTESFYSEALDEMRSVNVYTPPGYGTDTDVFYPVIYYLHAYSGTHSTGNSVMEAADDLINQGIIEPVIIVCANNYTSLFRGSFYVNSSLNGAFEDYMTEDVINWVETNYRAVSQKEYRTLMGQSMGGYGSFRYGILHKDKFRGLAAHGAAINLGEAIMDFGLDVLNENTPGPPYYFDFYNYRTMTMMLFSLGGAFSPNLNSPQTHINPRNVEFPISSTPSLIDSIYQKWESFDPITYANTLSNDDSVAILFGAGVNDELHLFNANSEFRNHLDSLGITNEFISHAGAHTMPPFFRDRSLIFLDSIMPSPIVSTSCETPSNLDATILNNTTASLSWKENGFSNSWQIILVPAGIDPIGANLIVVTTNPYLWNNLDANTSYDYYIRSECGDTNSEWAGPHNFATLACDISPATLPYAEGFETINSATTTNASICESTFFWSFETDQQGSGRARFGSYAALTNSGLGALTLDRVATGISTTNYCTLTIDLSNYTNTQNLGLSFSYADHSDASDENDKIWMRGSVNDNWIELVDLDPGNQADEIYQTISGIDIDATLNGVSPAQTVSSTFQVRFGQQGVAPTPNDGISFDDILIYLQNCPEPTAQQTTKISDQSAELSWIENGSATSWAIMKGIQGFDTATATPIIVSENQYDWIGLSENENYEWYVKSICGGESSSWIGPQSFKTKPCNISATALPVNIRFEGIHNTVTKDNHYCLPTFYLAFETSRQTEGRARVGTRAFQKYKGVGALTLDRVQTGSSTINSLIVTLDLSNYASPSVDLRLSFAYADHADESDENDKVWIRGSDDDEWLEIYNLDPGTQPDHVYQYITDLDISTILSTATPPQKASKYFQVKFGQEGTKPTASDGISFDDIKIEDISKSALATIYADEKSDEMSVYSFNGDIFIKSNKPTSSFKKEVSVYDIYGRTILQATLPPSSINQLKVNASGYLIVRVVTENRITTNKVLIK